ncbi:MAG: bifunctional DNA-formamidopyrimidine glycosylase/DNA-(apurinic or apyrimidinic site) lyase [Alphaproteobacteria bacterium]|nr:bifunctional DNA-formamidopyrimidine glycosylase/DNA-(apurinic or apyrimidinic site) lyase [Alphaproteobacteria bacterium]
MPELPEVETVRSGLAAVWIGHRLIRVETRRPDLRRPFPPAFSDRLRGRRVETVERRAKYLLATLDGDLVLLIHLGMSGRMTIAGAPAAVPGPHDHVLFESETGTVVTYADPRRFGLMDLMDRAERDGHPLLRDLGPEPLDPAFDGALLQSLLHGRKTPIKTALMDQRVLAGVGNIYACEALHRAGIAPGREAGNVRGEQASRLAESIRTVLEEAIAAGGSSLRDHVRPSGEIGYFQHRFAVYGREGKPCAECVCDGADAVRREVMNGRATFFCARKQR